MKKYRYIDIRTNIVESQKEKALNLADELNVSLSEVVRDALRMYLASDASKVVYMAFNQRLIMIHTLDESRKVYHKVTCHYLNGWGLGMLVAETGEAEPCLVCQP